LIHPMKIQLINPNIVILKSDPLTTGIPYMPVALAYMAASLRDVGESVEVIDAFGLDPFTIREDRPFCIQGLSPEEVAGMVDAGAGMLFLYAGILTSHFALMKIMQAVKTAHADIPVAVVENTQAVTSYKLESQFDAFFSGGADFVLTGESEYRSRQLVSALKSGTGFDAVDGLAYKRNDDIVYNPAAGYIREIDDIPFPAWDLFPLENYWRLKYAHGPQQGRYLPLLTSRGCPFPCRFCVAPSLNNQRWRPRSAGSVVDEMEEFVQKFNLDEFHIEDLNPTVEGSRIREICSEILQRGLRVRWKIAAGTMIPAVSDAETLQLMYDAGCRYISFSPETGSDRLARSIGKKFDFDGAAEAVRSMNTIGIKSQACFVLGFPEETAGDREKTEAYVRRLTRSGVDEIALFIISPVPGSGIYEEFYGFDNLSQLNFSPVWREDFKRLNRFRLRLYALFLLVKMRRYPLKIVRQSLNFLRRNFETKMEMVPYKALKIKWLTLKYKLAGLVRHDRAEERKPV